MAEYREKERIETHTERPIYVERQRDDGGFWMGLIAIVLILVLGLFIWAGQEREDSLARLEYQAGQPGDVSLQTSERETTVLPEATRTVPGPEVTRTVPGPERTVEGPLVVVPGPERTRTITQQVPGPTVTQTVAPERAQAEGTVQGIDPAAGAVTIAHGAIPTLDRNASTATYKVQNPAMLSRIQIGDEVEFTVEQQPSGKLLVTAIEPKGMATR